MVGGYAVMEYAVPRFTNDLDIVVATDLANRERLFAALAEFGAPLKGLSPDDFAKPDHFYQMGYPPMRVDVLTSIPGIELEAAWQRRKEVEIEGAAVFVIGKADLVASKLAAGRDQDLRDAELLRQSGSS
jgi:hypothetical protein